MKIFFQISFALIFILFSFSTFAQDYSFDVQVTGKGKPIILIPGLTCGGEVYDETVNILSKNYECHVLTLAGYNGQAPLEDYDGLYLDFFKNEIIQYIKDKQLENVTLIGHSIGGFLSQKIAIEQPKELSKVIVIDALPFLAGVYNPTAKAQIDTTQISSYRKNLETATKAELEAMHLRTAQFMALDSSNWQTIIDFAMKSDAQTVAQTNGELMGTDLREDLKSIKVPILVLVPFAKNPNYPFFTKEYVANTYAGQYKNAPDCELYIIEESKHFIMYDAFEKYINQIEAFLK